VYAATITRKHPFNLALSNPKVVRGIPEYTVFVAESQPTEVPKQRDLPDKDDDDDDYTLHRESSTPSPSGAVLAALVSAGLAGIFSLMLFELALASPVAMLQFGLGGAVASCALLAAWSILAGPDVLAALLFSVATALAICFAISVQVRGRSRSPETRERLHGARLFGTCFFFSSSIYFFL
jgi:hypothetical protein